MSEKKEKKVLITLKVTPKERELFKQKAVEAGLTLTDLIKKLVIEKDIEAEKKVKVIERYIKIDPKLLFEINSIGNNLNQIARRLNQNEKFDILPLLLEIKENLEEIKQSYAN
jgi:hypothetical protein